VSASTAQLRDLAISDSGFVFDPQTGAMFTVNETGLTVLLALRDGATAAELRERVRERFDEVTSALDEDLADFLHSLRQLGLVAADATKGSAR
jgi:PqqD family protein of HPr-rel-A system